MLQVFQVTQLSTMASASRMALWILGVLSMLMAGCAQPAPNTSPTTQTTDDLGRSVTHPANPIRIIPLAPSLTEVLFEIGAGDKVSAVSTADDFPSAVHDLPKVSTFPLDFESIAALNPDLLLATDQINSLEDADRFAALGIPLLFYNFDDLRDISRVMREIGQLLDVSATADSAASVQDAVIASYTTWTQSLPTRPSTLLLVGDRTLYAFGKGSYVQTMIELAGGESITATLDDPAPVLSDEFVLDAAPEIIVGSFGLDYQADQLLVHHPTFSETPAFTSGRFCSLESSLILRPGPRTIDGMMALAACLHPGATPEAS